MFPLNLRQPVGLLKYVAHLKLSDLFETSNCETLLGRHSTVEAVLVTDRSSVLPFCPNQTEQVNQSSFSRTET